MREGKGLSIAALVMSALALCVSVATLHMTMTAMSVSDGDGQNACVASNADGSGDDGAGSGDAENAAAMIDEFSNGNDNAAEEQAVERVSIPQESYFETDANTGSDSFHIKVTAIERAGDMLAIKADVTNIGDNPTGLYSMLGWEIYQDGIELKVLPYMPICDVDSSIQQGVTVSMEWQYTLRSDSPAEAQLEYLSATSMITTQDGTGKMTIAVA